MYIQPAKGRKVPHHVETTGRGVRSENGEVSSRIQYCKGRTKASMVPARRGMGIPSTREMLHSQWGYIQPRQLHIHAHELLGNC